MVEIFIVELGAINNELEEITDVTDYAVALRRSILYCDRNTLQCWFFLPLQQLNLLCFVPVSYTHLDVYKRQLVDPTEYADQDI